MSIVVIVFVVALLVATTDLMQVAAWMVALVVMKNIVKVENLAFGRRTHTMVKCVFCGLVPKHLSGSPEALAEAQSLYTCRDCKAKILLNFNYSENSEFTKALARHTKQIREQADNTTENVRIKTIIELHRDIEDDNVQYENGYDAALKFVLALIDTEKAEALRTPPNPKASGVRAGDIL